MKMKKYLSIAILLMVMASPVVFTSCGNDDPMEEVESPETKLDVWTSLSLSTFASSKQGSMGERLKPAHC